MILKVSIKDIAEIDLDEVMEIEEVAYPNHHWSRVSFENEISNKLATYRCALTPKGDMAGFYGFWQILEEAHITTIATHPDFRRQGVAKTLMFDIIESNIAAISLYDKFGFSTIGTRKKYYQDNNEDALIMFTENIWYDKFKSNYKKLKEEFYGQTK